VLFGWVAGEVYEDGGRKRRADQPLIHSVEAVKRWTEEKTILIKFDEKHEC